MDQTPRGPFASLVVLGESTVAGGGWLQGPEERWADILWHLLETAQESPLTYHNAGLGASVIAPSSPGYAASAKPSASERLPEDVIAYQPDLLVIAYGLNDMRAGMPVADFRAEMEGIIDRVRAMLDPLIVLVNVYHMPDYRFYPPFHHGSLAQTIAYNHMLEELAMQKDCVYADVWSAQGQRDYVVHQDTVHANKVGNLLIAHQVFRDIVQAAPGILANIVLRNAGTGWTRECLAAMKRQV